MQDEQIPTDSNITRSPRVDKTPPVGYNFNFCLTQTGKIHRFLFGQKS